MDNPEELVEAPRRAAWWRRMSARMGRASRAFGEQLRRIVQRKTIDESFYDDVLELLISADCGIDVSERLVASLRETGQ